ncbi:SH3 domain-containing protein [Agaribacterium haliotis]|uniref:SH3 domain-containing protein n=1 Tax=Agaribacterium haliotis TaxID=2013869 RepID=UPI000BB54463|nr:SH3 domain-containing protein [Agaribacterium haliotis]
MIKTRLFASLALCFSSLTTLADDDTSWLYKPEPLALEVIDSYLELHTGPGRGYPVFNVVEQGDHIDVLTRRPDWYEVRTQDNKVGWVKAAQLGRTLQASGEPADLPSVGYGNYSVNRWRIGMSAGSFSAEELADAETFSASLSYHPWSFLGGELEAGKFYGDEARGSQIAFNFVFEPFPLFDATAGFRLSPALIYGLGKTDFQVQPRQIVGDLESADHSLIGARLNYYLGRNFIMRGEYRTLTLDTDDQEEFDTWLLGFTTFF